MKILVIVMIIVFYSCTTSKEKTHISHKSNFTSEEYEITNIDSINCYYIIYAKKEDVPYKIISKKVMSYSCIKIEVNKRYKLELSHNLLQRVPDNSKFQPINYLDLKNCIKLDDTTEVCRERYMNGLYYSHNIKGLCIIGK